MSIIRQLRTSLRFLLAITVVLGIIYPAVIYVVGQVGWKNKADGSLITSQNHVVGSSLIGQNFQGSNWFHSRPSAAGKDGYDALSSAATNAGPNEPSLLQTVKDRRDASAKEEGVKPSQVPSDALTSSASGLDPDISPAYAYLQAARVADTRQVSIESVKALIQSATTPRTFGFMGEPRVNVLELNIALNALK